MIALVGEPTRGMKANFGALLIRPDDPGALVIAAGDPDPNSDDRWCIHIRRDGLPTFQQADHLRHDFWDITQIVTFRPDPAHYQIARISAGGVVGALGFTAGGGMLLGVRVGAASGGWARPGDKTTVENTNDRLIIFPRWRIVGVKGSHFEGHEFLTVNAIAAQASPRNLNVAASGAV